MDWNRYVDHLFSTTEKKSIWDRMVLAILEVGEMVYAFGINMLISFYDTGHMRQHRMSAFTISVGNITAGGTGKTPFVQYLTKACQRRGDQVAILSRGYRGAYEKKGAIVSDGKQVLLTADEAGDEPYLLARTLPGTVVAVGKSRIESGQRVERIYKPDVVILDDGFQHWMVKRDMDIVLIDATNPFSNGHIFPRGLLREPVDNIDRADAFVITKVDLVSEEKVTEIREVLLAHRGRVPVLLTSHRPGKVQVWQAWKAKSEERHAGPRKVVTMSALGNPASFEETVREARMDVVGTIRLEDHHHYSRTDFERAAELVESSRADGVIITEKDAVKVKTDMVPDDLRLYVLPMELVVLSGETEFWDYMNDEREAGRCE